MEQCQYCEKHYEYVWSAPNKTWEKVTGIIDDGGLSCMKCFDDIARQKGIVLYWDCRDTGFKFDDEGG